MTTLSSDEAAGVLAEHLTSCMHAVSCVSRSLLSLSTFEASVTYTVTILDVSSLSLDEQRRKRQRGEDRRVQSTCAHEGGCDSQKENWMCAQCNKVFCGRYAHGHMAAHADANPTHCIAVGLDDLSFWCYACEAYLAPVSTIPTVKAAYATLHTHKFGVPPANHASPEAIAEITLSSASSSSSSSSSSDHNHYVAALPALIPATRVGSLASLPHDREGNDSETERPIARALNYMATTAEYKHRDVVGHVLAVLYGNALGDAVGLATEFMDRNEIQKAYGDAPIPFPAFKTNFHNCRWQKGDWTDDTDQLILIMDSLRLHGRVHVVDFARRLKTWIRNGFKELGDNSGMGLGMTVSSVCHQPDFIDDPHAASERMWEKTGRNLAANGAVMRTSILGLYEYNDPVRVLSNTIAYAKVTHHDGRCVASCTMITYIVSALLRLGQERAAALSKEEREALIKEAYEQAVSAPSSSSSSSSSSLSSSSSDASVTGSVTGLLPAHVSSFHEFVFEKSKSLATLELDEQKSIGYTLKCMGSGLWALRTDLSFNEAINALVREGGDADTNAAVAGAVLGARFGYSSLLSSSSAWLSSMPNRRWFEHRIIDFLDTMGLVTDEVKATLTEKK